MGKAAKHYLEKLNLSLHVCGYAGESGRDHDLMINVRAREAGYSYMYLCVCISIHLLLTTI